MVLATGSGFAANGDKVDASQDFLRRNMNLTVDPGNDFFTYANGGWLKRNPIPASESKWGIGHLVQDELYARLRRINESAAAQVNAPGSDLRKIGDFWTTATNTIKAEQLGLGPLRNELQQIARMLKLLGQSDGEAKSAANEIMKFETALAKASRKLEDLRDPQRNYNKMSPAELSEKHTPAIRWNERLLNLGLKTDAIIVGQPEFFDALQKLLGDTPVSVQRDYLRFHLISEY